MSSPPWGLVRSVRQADGSVVVGGRLIRFEAIAFATAPNPQTAKITTARFPALGVTIVKGESVNMAVSRFPALCRVHIDG